MQIRGKITASITSGTMSGVLPSEEDLDTGVNVATSELHV
jgi:hypothetical protein